MRTMLMSVVTIYSLLLFAFVANGCNKVDDSIATVTGRGIVDHDAAADGVSDAEAEAGPVALAVGAETCDDETLSLPDGFVRPHETVWHLCYRTPSGEDSTSPLAQQESRSVTFTQHPAWMSATVDLIRIPTDDSNVRWTASAVIRVPDTSESYALFNARNDYGGNVLWAVGADETGHTLETHGTLSAWRVLPNGRRVSAALRPIVNGCLDTLMPEIFDGASFLPDGEVCPEEFYVCGSGRFHCEYEP